MDEIGVEFTVAATDIDETPSVGEDPVTYVRRLAIGKANAFEIQPDDVVIAADTTVDVDGEILAKPDDEVDAMRLLSLLSGRTHLVHTGVAVRYGDVIAADVATTAVTFRPLSDDTLQQYIRTGEPMGKAGAYGIQGEAGAFVDGIDGSITNVIGLPISLLDELMTKVGLSLAALADPGVTS